MPLPQDTTSSPPVWDAATSFQCSFEDNEDWDYGPMWESYGNVTTSSTGGAADGDKYAVLATDGGLSKAINNCATFWVRASFRLLTSPAADGPLLYVTAPAQQLTAIALSYNHAGDSLFCAVTGEWWPRTGKWQTVEYLVDVIGMRTYAWFDGTYMGDGAIDDLKDARLYLYIGSETAGIPCHVDAIKISTDRPGLPGRQAQLAGAYVRDGDVELDGVPFNLLEGQYQEQDISGFAPRMGAGAPAYSDLSGFQHFLIPSLHHGIGQVNMAGEGEGDENMYLVGEDVDTTGVGIIRPANRWEDTDTLTNGTCCAHMLGGEILSCDMAGKAVYGLKFASAKTSASYPVLFWRDGASLYYKEFTCTRGVTGLFYNGQYLFVSLGGARMQKTTDLSTWSDVGSATLPPTDMGAIAAHDEFMWVADATQPIVYRAAQTDGSDLAKETVLGLGAHRVGPGSVPINSMCSFQGRLYVGRQDGLYAVSQDADQVYVQCVETFPASSYNCRAMTVYEGYLVYAVGRRVYRLGGVSESGIGAKMDITPGPLSDSYPYSTVEHWEAFTTCNGYLFAAGYPVVDYAVMEHAGLYCYNGSGWHRPYLITNVYGSDVYPIGLNNSPSPTSKEPRIHACCCYRTSSTATPFTESYASARLGNEKAGGYGPLVSGELTTSWMSFGLPMVPKLFRMVRFETENLDETNYIGVYYTCDTGHNDLTEEPLGILQQPDANFLVFPADTWGKRLRLTLKLVGTTDLVIHRIVIQYMDRPTPVWGYSMTLDLSSPVRTHAGTSGSHSVESLKQHLRDCREKAAYVRFVDKDGNESDVFVSDGPRFSYVGGKAVATLTLMVVKRYINSPAVVNVLAT